MSSGRNLLQELILPWARQEGKSNYIPWMEIQSIFILEVKDLQKKLKSKNPTCKSFTLNSSQKKSERHEYTSKSIFPTQYKI